MIFPLGIPPQYGFCVWLDIWDILSFQSNLTFLDQWWPNWSKKKARVRADGSLFFIFFFFWLEGLESVPAFTLVFFLFLARVSPLSTGLSQAPYLQLWLSREWRGNPEAENTKSTHKGPIQSWEANWLVSQRSTTLYCYNWFIALLFWFLFC